MGSTTKEIELIKSRNERVEADKAWEVSVFRRTTVAIITYIIATIFLWFIQAPYPHLNSLVPTLGYILSTLTIPSLKKYWTSKIYKK